MSNPKHAPVRSAYIVVEGDNCYVVTERDGARLDAMPIDAAEALGHALLDAAHEPDWCRRCGERYAIHGDECDLCNERPAPRWT